MKAILTAFWRFSHLRILKCAEKFSFPTCCDRKARFLTMWVTTQAFLLLPLLREDWDGARTLLAVFLHLPPPAPGRGRSKAITR